MKVKKFQEGGVAEPAPAQVPAQAQGQEGAPQGGNPEEQLAAIAEQIIQQLGPEAAAMLAQMIMQMLQGAEQAPQGPPQYQRQGGKLVMIGRKSN